MSDKVIRDGMVAVLYSPGYGAGWSTWNSYRGYGNVLLFDPSLVYMVEEMNKVEEEDRKASWVDNIVEYCTKKYPEGYFGGADDLQICWIPVGTQFKVNEYDGSESIEFKETDSWTVA